jgi:small subunit ribosomal protein S4
MGDTKQKHRSFNRPKKPFDRARIDEENILLKRYGLKNKREIWRAKSVVSKMRKQAKSLIGQSDEEQRKFFEKLNKMGVQINTISDILALTEKNILDKRLQTFVFNNKLANTIKGARQLIVHKKILVDKVIINVPSFWVTKGLKNKISLKKRISAGVVVEHE